MSDPWAQRLKWIAVGIAAIAALVALWMFQEGSKALGIVEFYEGRDRQVIEEMRREADRLEAAREALDRCRRVDTPDACR